MVYTFTQHKGVTDDNASLVLGKEGAILNATSYNCRNPGHLMYTLPEAGRTGTCSIQVTINFFEKQIHKSESIKKIWVILDT